MVLLQDVEACLNNVRWDHAWFLHFHDTVHKIRDTSHEPELFHILHDRIALHDGVGWGTVEWILSAISSNRTLFLLRLYTLWRKCVVRRTFHRLRVRRRLRWSDECE